MSPTLPKVTNEMPGRVKRVYGLPIPDESTVLEVSEMHLDLRVRCFSDIPLRMGLLLLLSNSPWLEAPVLIVSRLPA